MIQKRLWRKKKRKKKRKKRKNFRQRKIRKPRLMQKPMLRQMQQTMKRQQKCQAKNNPRVTIPPQMNRLLEIQVKFFKKKTLIKVKNNLINSCNLKKKEKKRLTKLEMKVYIIEIKNSRMDKKSI